MRPAYHTLIHRKAHKKARFQKSRERWFKRIEKVKQMYFEMYPELNAKDKKNRVIDLTHFIECGKRKGLN